VEVFGIVKGRAGWKPFHDKPALQMGGGGGGVEIEERRQECLRYSRRELRPPHSI